MLGLSALIAFQLAAPTDVGALVARARAARSQQDSALASYQAVVRQRISSSIGVARGLIGQIGRPRLAARIESVSRVGWDHERGAWGEIIAARSVVPIVGENDPEGEGDDVALVLPYYPGRDPLWPVSEMREVVRMRGDEWITHPLDRGSDSVYAFAAGDSLTFRLPDGSTIRLREVRIRPRRPDSKLVVGSLWLDVASGALVRAAYRPSMPMDLWPFFGEGLQGHARERVKDFGPFLGNVREVIVENGLYEGRFWLPRTRIASAEGTAKVGRVTASIEQTFTYEGVREVPAGKAYGYRPPTPDIDPRYGRIRRPPWRGNERGRGRPPECRPPGDSSSRWSPDSLLVADDLRVMYVDGVRIRVLMPCRSRDLVESSELPKSIYDPSEELFTQSDFDALRKDVEGALSLGSQPEWQPLPTTLHYGLDRGLIRYNRIEGLSVGIGVERVLGSGYTVAAQARIGTADHEPNAELFLGRANGSRDLQIGAYRRLVAANDWGSPLTVGASINAALFARDDGFYYRALGAELLGTYRSAVDAPPIAWRLFAERQDSASVETQESVSRWISGTKFQPNIAARAGEYFGGAAALGFSRGVDPEGFRLSGAIRTEAAAGETEYGRATLDASLARGLGRGVQLTLTGGAGGAAGELPIQRYFFLGGPYTIRGHRPGTLSGDAFWLGRLELAKGHPLVRPTIFGDIGWAGPGDSWNAIGRPLSGAGFGGAFLDGMVRLDIARGIGDTGRWRADFYFEIR